MNRTLVSTVVSLAIFGSDAFAQEQMTPVRFREVVSAPGDQIPLNAKLSATGPLWTNVTSNVSFNYKDGKAFQEKMSETSKTVSGKYVVTTVQSQSNKQPMHSIMTYDENARCYKVWSLFGETITEGRIVYDLDKKIYAMDSAYGDGFTELGVGSFSNTEMSSRTFIFKKGVLFCTREVKTTPVAGDK